VPADLRAPRPPARLTADDEGCSKRHEEDAGVVDGVDDRQLAAVLGRFARLSAYLLEDPAAWLGDGVPEQSGGGVLGRLRGVGEGARRLLTGRMHPGAPGWQQATLDARTRWWVQRIQAVAAPIAATPRVAGALANRLPLQDALGAATAGLAVCAVAREHGKHDPEDWVPLLGRVLFERDLTRPAQVPWLAEAEAAAAAGAPDSTPDVGDEPPPGVARRIASGLWRLTQILWSLPGVFDDRPRGALVWRALGQLPLVGLPAGVLDERGAVRKAAKETEELLANHA
jgi:hypothetical protein